ncbi:MAG: hypothetical protein ACP5NW_05835 [Candidatus Woesearchaeota archaeon]
MPHKYVINRETGIKESGAIYMEVPADVMFAKINPNTIEMDLPIGYHPMYMYLDSLLERKRYYLVLRCDVEDIKDIRMYIGNESYPDEKHIRLNLRPVFDYKIEDSKKAGGWAYVGAIYMREITFPDLSGRKAKITRKEIAKYVGIIRDSSGKIIHREPPDLITLIQEDKTKKRLEELF